MDKDRYPQSGPMMAWDTMAVLMAAYESAEKGSAFVELDEYVECRPFEPTEMPSPKVLPNVFQTV